LLGYPVAVRVLFAAPPVIAGWLFKLQLGGLHRDRLHELGRVAQPLPRFGLMVWAFHPWAALRRVSQIEGSRLRSVPLTVMDWEGEAVSTPELPGAPRVVPEHPVLLGAPVDVEDEASELDECTEGNAGEEVDARPKAGRTPVPDELYLEGLRKLVAENAGVVPSIREVERRLSIGQERAGRLVIMLSAEPKS
jgi:hypothetical protein